MGNINGIENKKNIKRKISYIIGHRSDGSFRDRNLEIVVKWLLKLKIMCKNIELKIIVVEQDAVKKYKKTKGIEHIFIFNDGYYNRGWAFNVGFRLSSDSDYFYFADNDIVMNDDDMLCVFNNCFDYDAVNPYHEIYDSINSMITSKEFSPGNFIINDEMTKREHTCFSGGIMGISRQSMKYISGWDERFRGRGWEDYAFTAKINLFLSDKLRVFNIKALHLWHPAEENTTREINYELNKEYSGYKINDYVNHIYNSSLKFGGKNKYTSEKTHIFEEDTNRSSIFTKGKDAFIKYQECVQRKHPNISNESLLNLIYLNLCEQHMCENHEIDIPTAENNFQIDYSYQSPTGPQGPQESQGVRGPRGYQGDVGPRGYQGDIGPRGDRGEQGPPGVCHCECCICED